MKRIGVFALVLALMVLAFTGCGKTEQEKLVGTWEGQLDLTNVILGEVPESMEDLDVGAFVVTVVFTFTEEGVYTMQLDETSMAQAVADFVSKLEAYVKGKLQASAEEKGLTAQQVLEMLGMTPEEFTQQLLGKVDVQALADKVLAQAAARGQFIAKDGKLHLSESADTVPNEEIYNTYTLEGDVLTITAATGGSETDTNLLKLVYPIILKKAA